MDFGMIKRAVFGWLREAELAVTSRQTYAKVGHALIEGAKDLGITVEGTAEVVAEAIARKYPSLRDYLDEALHELAKEAGGQSAESIAKGVGGALLKELGKDLATKIGLGSFVAAL